MEDLKNLLWRDRSGKGKAVVLLVAFFVLAGAINSLGSDESTISTTTTRAIVAQVASTDAPTTSEAPTTTAVPTTTTTEAPTTTTLPAAQVHQGSGDKVLDIQPPDGLPALLYVKWAGQNSNFAVWGVDSNNEQTQLFVNVMEPYEGIRPMGMQEEGTVRLQVEGSGSWQIEVRSIRTARGVAAGSTIEGQGDDVLRIEGEPDLAIIKGNTAGQANFAVWTWGQGSLQDLLVNELEAYSGEVLVGGDAEYFIVEATGPWSIQLTD